MKVSIRSTFFFSIFSLFSFFSFLFIFVHFCSFFFHYLNFLHDFNFLPFEKRTSQKKCVTYIFHPESGQRHIWKSLNLIGESIQIGNDDVALGTGTLVNWNAHDRLNDDETLMSLSVWFEAVQFLGQLVRVTTIEMRIGRCKWHTCT